MYNHEFRLIDSESKAYVLGLWYADGCIRNNTIQITLHKKDEQLVTKIKQEFPFFNINTNGNALVLRKQSKKLAEDFRLHGALSRKSYENKDVLSIPNLDTTLVHHFVRGYFDGDGSVYLQKVNNIKVEIGGAGFGFVSQLLKILYDNQIGMFMQCKHPSESNVRMQNYYVIYTSSYTQSKKFADFIYKEATVFMQRKRDKLSVELIPRNAKERLTCEHCNSANTTYIGFRDEKVRIYCKDCNKRSTQTAPSDSNITSGEDELLES